MKNKKRLSPTTDTLLVILIATIIIIAMINIAMIKLDTKELIEVCHNKTDWSMIDLLQEKISEAEEEMYHNEGHYVFLNCELSEEVKNYIIESEGMLYDSNWEKERDWECYRTFMRIQEAQGDIKFSKQMVYDYSHVEVCIERLVAVEGGK